MALCHASQARAGFFPQCAKNHRENLCPQKTQIYAETEEEFLICVFRRVLRANPDPVSSGYVGPFALPGGNYRNRSTAGLLGAAPRGAVPPCFQPFTGFDSGF